MLPRQQEPWGFFTSQAQCPALTSAVIIVGMSVTPAAVMPFLKSASVMSKQ